MTRRPKAAGDDIEARCTRCREITNHTIVAMVEDRVVRVQCNTCNGVHNYHASSASRPAPAKTSAPRASVPRAPRMTRGRKEAAAAEEWEAAVGRADEFQVQPYAMNRKFGVDDLVKHPTFGMGVVKAMVPPGKMEVLFQSGSKLLRCG